MGDGGGAAGPFAPASESDLLLTEHTGITSRTIDDDDAGGGDVWGAPSFEDSSGGGGAADGLNVSSGYDFANMSDGQYLALMLGPKNVGLPLLVPITLIYVVIFMSGVVGNVAVCLVIVKNKSMHTATNYYLFSLAISDLLMLALGKSNMMNDVIPGWKESRFTLGFGFKHRNLFWYIRHRF